MSGTTKERNNNTLGHLAYTLSLNPPLPSALSSPLFVEGGGGGGVGWPGKHQRQSQSQTMTSSLQDWQAMKAR